MLIQVAYFIFSRTNVGTENYPTFVLEKSPIFQDEPQVPHFRIGSLGAEPRCTDVTTRRVT